MHQLAWNFTFLAPDIECECLKLRARRKCERLCQTDSKCGPDGKLLVIGLANLRADQRIEHRKLRLRHGCLRDLEGSGASGSGVATSSGGATSAPVLTLCSAPTWPRSACSTAPRRTSLLRITSTAAFSSL